jgi:hypothetical protein
MTCREILIAFKLVADTTNDECPRARQVSKSRVIAEETSYLLTSVSERVDLRSLFFFLLSKEDLRMAATMSGLLAS